MRAVLLDKPGQIWVEDINLLEPEQGAVIVQTAAAFSCWTDVIQRRVGGQLMGAHIRGHTAYGTVVAVGEGTTRTKVGDTVIVGPQPTCGECFWCVRGQRTQCAGLPARDRIAARRQDGTPLRASTRVGAYAEQMNVHEHSVVPIQSSLPQGVLAAMGCGVGGGLSAVFNVATINPGDSIAVVGAGVYGMAILQGAAVAGATTLIAVEPVPARRELALALGATHVVDPGAGDPVAAVKALTEGRGVDTAFEAAGEPEAMENAFLMARSGGDVVMGGFGLVDATVTFNMNDIAMRGKRIMSSQIGNISILRDIPTYVRLIEQGRVQIEPLISGTFSIDRIEEAFDGQETRELMGCVIVP